MSFIPRGPTFSTYHVEIVATFSRYCGRFQSDKKNKHRDIIIRTQTAIISGVFACRACPIEINLADATHVVIGDVPSPGRYRTPLSNFNLHDSSFC